MSTRNAPSGLGVCPVCRGRGVSELHVARCSLDEQCRRKLSAVADAAGVAPHRAAELMSHLRDRFGDNYCIALERTRSVIGLGWRP